MTAPARASFAPALLAAALLTPGPAAAQRFEPWGGAGLRWFKGNTHTHTTESDGDSPPEVVAAWYKRHGYQFLVLSDHNVLTDPRGLAGLVDSGFILVGGEELTTAFERRPVHVNGLNIPHVVQPGVDSTLVATIQLNVDIVRAVSGVPHINHPNFGWAFGTRELLQIRNDPLLEIWSGHPAVNSEGGDDAPSVEVIWDELLTGGKRIYGIAVDDAHHFQGEFGPDRVNPGRGWVAVLAPRLEPAALMASLERGLFYASSGVALRSLDVAATRIAIEIEPRGDFKYTTYFIGDGGRVLARVGGLAPRFDLAMVQGPVPTYVRARVEDSRGGRAWVQPVFVAR